MIRKIFSVALCSVMSSCATGPIDPDNKVLFVAVAGEQVFVGVLKTVRGFGRFHLKSLQDPTIVCTGRLNITFLPKGRAFLDCSKDRQGFATIDYDSNTSGKGSGTSSFGKLRLAYGYSLRKLNRIIEFPNNQVLVSQNNQLRLHP